jgi:hypothetical protein
MVAQVEIMILMSNVRFLSYLSPPLIRLRLLMIVLSELERVGLERRLTDLGLVHRYSLPLGITPPSQVPAAGRGIDVRLGDHVIERIL